MPLDILGAGGLDVLGSSLSGYTLVTPILASFYQTSGGGLISVPASAGADTVCLLGATQELDAKTLDSAVAKGTWTASGAWTIPAVTLGGLVSGGAQSLSNLGTTYIGDTANTMVTLGLTINQGAADDAILEFKSSDVTHGCTTITETDTYGSFQKWSSTGGALIISGLSDSNLGAANPSLVLRSFSGIALDTTKSIAGRAAVECYTALISGTGQAAPTADGNIFALKIYTGDTNNCRWICDEDGDTWQNGGVSLNNNASFDTSIDSAAVADQVSIGGYEISSGHRALAISSEDVVLADADETKFSNKLPVRINGATFYIMLTAT